jgi:hypothetical protein
MLPVHTGGNTAHGDQHAKAVDMDEITEDNDEEKKDGDLAPPNSSSIQLQPLSQGQVNEGNGFHGAGEDEGEDGDQLPPPPPPAMPEPTLPPPPQANPPNGSIWFKICSLWFKIKDFVRQQFDKPMVLLSALILIYAVYHSLFVAVSYWIKIELSKEQQEKGIGKWIWSVLWVSALPMLVYPHMALYSHTINVAAEERAAANAAAAAAAAAANVAAANAAAAAPEGIANEQEGNANEQQVEYRFGPMNANAVMMFLGGGARVVYLTVGNTWPLVTIAHGVAFLVEVVGLLLKYKSERVLNIGMVQV